jgi:molybdopterin converting factor small subunit
VTEDCRKQLFYKGNNMSVKVLIDSAFLDYTGGQKEIEVEGKTVNQCLEHLWVLFPDLKVNLYDKQGKVLSDVGFFVNDENAFPNQPVQDGDELSIIIPIGGG